MKFYSAKNVKQDDMVNVLIKEIIRLEQDLTFTAEDNMRRLNYISLPSKMQNIFENKERLEKMEKDMVELQLIRHRLNIFYKIFEIITEEGDKNEKEPNN